MEESNLRVLIVEDEPITRAGLREIIDWARVGCEICGEAADGQEALQYLLECKRLPDVVLTDVEMPRMDGLELLREIWERSLPVVTVVLSGYDQFRYAQNALRYGAAEYLLKPLREKEVLEVFGRLREQILRTHRESEMRRNVDSIMRSDSGHLLELALSLCLSDPEQDISTFGNLLRHYGYIIDGEASLGLFECANKQQSEEMELLVRSWLRQRLPRRFVCADLREGFAALMLCPLNEAEAAIKEAYHTPQAEAMALSIRTVLFPDVTSLSSVAQVIPQLRRYKSESFYYGFGQIHHFAETSVTEKKPSKPFALGECLERYIRDDQPQKLRDAMCEYLQALSAERPPRDLFVIKLTEAYTQAVERLRDTEPGLEALSFEQLYLQLTGCVSQEELAERFAELVAEMYTEYRNLTYGEADVIEQVRKHIDEHYAELLTLTSLSNTFFLSPNYLSTQFSQKVGITLSNYLRNVRLRHAKQALVASRRNIYEIAVSVGYGDYRYFCKIFKNEFGISPLQYRQKNGSADAEERRGDGTQP